MGNEIAVIEPNGSTAIAPREQVGGLLRPVAAPADVLDAQNETRKLISTALKKGRDFGPIPGAGDKPVLLKPGGERICAAFGCAPRYRIVSSEIDHDREVEWTKRKKEWKNRKFAGWKTESGVSRGLYRYVVECELEHRGSGTVIGQGIASASTMESKYIDRPRDSENTVLKMAEKRAFIAATLNAFGLSDEFTQDIDDMQSDDDVGPPAPRREAQPERATPGQVDEIRMLLQAEVITEGERKQMNRALSSGLGAERAGHAIERLKNTINERMTEVDEGDPEQPKHATQNKALDEARKLYRSAIDEFAPHLALDDDERDAFEERVVGRTSKEDWTVNNYRSAIKALEAGEARLPEEADEEAA